MTINLFSNNAKTTLAGSITSSQTTINVSPGTGDLFPQPVAGQSIFKLTLVSATDSSVYEVCDCTDRSIDTMTIVRGQEGTAAAPFSLNDVVGHFDTAGVMTDLIQSEQLQTAKYTFADATGTPNDITASIPSNLTGLTEGLQIVLNASATNTGPVTLNLTLGSLITGVIPVYVNGGAIVPAGAIVGPGYKMLLVYNGFANQWELTNPFISLAGYAPLNSPNFTGLPTGPTFPVNTVSALLATTAFATSCGIGNHQTWKSLGGITRGLNVAYGNPGPRPIFVSVVVNAPASTSAAGYVDGIMVAYTGAGPSQIAAQMSIIVPPGSAYEFTSGGATLQIWAELS